MPVIEDFSGDNCITLEWVIDKFSLNVCTYGKSLLSPKYEFKKLGDARWQLELFPRGSTVPGYVACYLWMEIADTTEELDTYNITLSLPTNDCDTHKKQCTHTFDGTDVWKCNEYIRIDMLKRQHLACDSLRIRCKIYPEYVASERSAQEDFGILSRDMTSLLESEAYHDLILETMGVQFKVHKSIMKVRWPILMSALKVGDEFSNEPLVVHIPNANPDTLKTLIKYVYSGTIDGPNASRDVFMAAVLYDFVTLRKNLSVFPKVYVGKTEHNIEQKTVVWHLDDVSLWDRRPLSFIRVLPIIELYFQEIILVFTTKNIDGNERIDVQFRLQGFKEEMPVFLDCKMNLSIAKGEPQAYHTATHLFETDEPWHFPHFINKSDIVDRTKSLITMELSMCDGPKRSRVVITQTDFFTDFIPMQDLRKLSTDISMLALPSPDFRGDTILVSKDLSTFVVHQAILDSRWPELRSSFTPRTSEYITIDLNIEEDLLQTIIMYIYSGNSKDISIEIAREILEAKQCSIPKLLEQKCQSILENIPQGI